MGLSDVVDNLRSLKKTVKKPIVAFRETVHNAYTKAYIGSPERVDEFYNYIKVYSPSKHNDLCMMSITASINRLVMIPNKHAFFHVLKLERQYDRMIACRKQSDVTGDMAIQILSGHNATFMSKYRRYKTITAAKELKRRNKQFKALNVRRHAQLPDSSNDDSCIYGNCASFDAPNNKNGCEENTKLSLDFMMNSTEKTKILDTFKEDKSEDLAEIAEALKVVLAAARVPEEQADEKPKPAKKDVSIVCELTKPETVVAAPNEVQNSAVPLAAKEDDSLAISAAKANLILKKHQAKSSTEKSMMSMTKKHDAKFKVAKSVTVKREKIERAENLKCMEVPEKKKVEPATMAASLLEDVMEQLQLEDQKAAKIAEPQKIAAPENKDTDGHEEFDKVDVESYDGSDIEELEKIEDQDVDALEYEMI